MHEALERLYRERPRRRPSPPPRLARRLDRARPRAGRRDRRRARARRAPGRAGDRCAGSRGCWSRFLGRGGRAGRPASSPGCSRPSSARTRRPNAPLWRSTSWVLHGAIDRVDRDADGRALVHRLQARELGHRARQARGGGEAAATALPDRGRRALGCVAGRRHLPPAAGHFGAAAARGRPRRSRGGARLLRALQDRRGSTARSSRRLLAEARERADRIVARMRAGDIRRDPGPRPGLRDHGVCPPFCDLAPICRRDRAPVEPLEEDEVSGRAPTPEQAAAIEASARSTPGRGRRRHRQDRRDGRPLLPPRSATKASLPTPCSPSPSPRRPRPSCGADPGRDRPAGRGRARSEPAELVPSLGCAWVTTIHGFCNRLLAAHPVAAGIDPRFRVLDAPEAERAARRGLRRGAGGVPRRRRARTAKRLVARLRRRRPARGRDRRPRRAAQPRRQPSRACPSRPRPTWRGRSATLAWRPRPPSKS